MTRVHYFVYCLSNMPINPSADEEARGLPARFNDLTVQFARLRLHVPPGRGIPLPLNVPVEPGAAQGAAAYQKWLQKR